MATGTAPGEDSFTYDVFVSFSSIDNEATGMSWHRPVAAALVSELGSRDLKVFFSNERRRTLPSSALAERLDGPDERSTLLETQGVAGYLLHALERACHCIALTSPTYEASRWCSLELEGFANLTRQDPRRLLVELPLDHRIGAWCADWWEASARGSPIPEPPNDVSFPPWRSLGDVIGRLVDSPTRAGDRRKDDVKAFAPLPIWELYLCGADRVAEGPVSKDELLEAASKRSPKRYIDDGRAYPFDLSTDEDPWSPLTFIGQDMVRRPGYEEYEMLVRSEMVGQLLAYSNSKVREYVSERSRTRRQRMRAAFDDWITDLRTAIDEVAATFGSASPAPDPPATIRPWRRQASRDAHDLLAAGVSPCEAPDERDR